MEGSHSVNIKQHFTIELVCPICLNEYDFGEHIPMIICCNQHYVCLTCIEKSFEYAEEDEDEIPCHFCKEPVFADCVDRFRLMEEFIHTSNAIDRYSKDVQSLIDKLTSQNQRLWEALKEQRQILDQKSKMLEILSVQNQCKGSQRHHTQENLSSSRRVVMSSANSSNQAKKKQPRYADIIPYNKQKSKLNSERSKTKKVNTSIKNTKIKANSFVVISKDTGEMKKVEHNFDLNFRHQEELSPLSSKHCRPISRVRPNRRPLPYVVSNPKMISSQDLKRIIKNEPIAQKKGQKVTYLRILGKYDFCLLRELDLQRSGLHQRHFQSKSLQGCFPSLQHLNLSKNRFTCIPPLICQFTTLTKLTMSNNTIDRVSHQLIQLFNLQYLDLWDNQLTVVPQVIYMMKKLEKVDLSNNRITSVLPWICEVKVRIDLFGNPIDIIRAVPPRNNNNKKVLKKAAAKINRTIL